MGAKRPFAVCLMGMALFYLSTMAWAQQNRGSITGTVLDATGAVVPGVPINVTDLHRGLKFSVTSTDAGVFSVPALTIGEYRLEAEKAGFKKFVQEPIKVHTGSTTTVNVTLVVGQITEQVSVTGSAPLLDTTSAQVGTVMTSKQYLELPLSLQSSPVYGSGRRQPSQFILLVPGFNTGVENDTVGKMFNGNQYYQGVTLIDGVATPTSQDGGQSEFFGLPYEAMEEFKVQTSTPTADGGSAMAVESYTMRSGTNTYHGSVYDFFRNHALNARGQFPTPLKSLLVMHELGGTFGGPLSIPGVYDGQNRTFFFMTLGDFRKSGQPPTQPIYTIPTLAMRGGDFSALLDPANGGIVIYDPDTTRFDAASGMFIRDPFPNNIIPPNRIVPQAAYFVGLIEPPNLPGTNGGLFSNFLDTNQSKLSDWTWSAKVDHSFNDRHKISVSYWANNNTSASHGGDAYNKAAYGRGTTTAAGYRIHDYVTISPNTQNDAFIGYTNLSTAGKCDPRAELGRNPAGIPNLEIYDPDGAGNVRFGGGSGFQYFRLGGAIGGCTALPSGKTAGTARHTWQAGDTLNYVRGRHDLKFGVVGTREYLTFQRVGGATLNFANLETAQPGVANTGDAFASFLLGHVDSVVASGPSTSLRYHNPRLAFFGQDAWKMTPKLTVNYGLRYEVPYITGEKYDRWGGFDRLTPNPGAGDIPGALVFLGEGAGRTGTTRFRDVHPSRKEFSPRLGIAYALDSKTSIRAGYSLVFSYGNGTALGFDAGTTGWLPGIVNYSSSATSSDNGVTPAMTLTGGLPPAPFSLPHLDPAFQNGQAPFYWDPQSGLEPYMQQWTFSIQRYLPGNFFVDIAYVGQKGTRLTGNQDNQNQLRVSMMSEPVIGPILTQPYNSPAAIAAGIQAPFPGFSGTVAQALRPFPQYSAITPRFDPSGMSKYNGLQMQLRKTVGDLSLQMNFTQQKNLSNTRAGQFSNSGGTNVDTFNLALENAPVRFESSRMFVAMWLYQLPFGKGKRFGSGASGVVNQLIGGWQIGAIHNYRNGQNLFIGGGVPNPIFNNSFRPHRISPDVRLADCSDARIGAGPLLNINAFAPNSSLELGTSPPLLPERGCAWYGEDFTIQKRFPITETVRLEFRSEFYNLLNRTKWSDPGANINSPASFGKILGVDGRYQARIAQFALKLIF